MAHDWPVATTALNCPSGSGCIACRRCLNFTLVGDVLLQLSRPSRLLYCPKEAPPPAAHWPASRVCAAGDAGGLGCGSCKQAKQLQPCTSGLSSALQEVTAAPQQWGREMLRQFLHKCFGEHSSCTSTSSPMHSAAATGTGSNISNKGTAGYQ